MILLASTSETINFQEVMTSSATPTPSTNGKQTLKPDYLSGKVRRKSKNVTSRSSHQKKRDWKTHEILRVSNELERKWIEKYSIYKYGQYIPPIDEKKPSKNKKRSKKSASNSNNNSSATAETAAETPNLHTIEVGFGDIVVDVCLEMLLTLDESWENRIHIITDFVDQLCQPSITDNIFALKMCRFLYAIGHQFCDPRSLIIQAMLKQISILAKNNTQRFLFFSPYILKELAQTWMVRIEVLREPGLQLGNTIVQTCRELDKNYLLLSTMFELIQSKHADIRSQSADFIVCLLRDVPLLEKDDGSDDEKLLWQDIDSAVQKCIRDSSSATRVNGYRALKVYAEIAPKACGIILAKMTNAQIKKYNEANEDVHYT